MTEKDWYALLQLRPDASAEEIAAAVEKRSRQASAMANTNPERSQQLREQVRAMKRDLLSGPEARASYDASRAVTGGPGNAAAGYPPVGHPAAGYAPAGYAPAAYDPAAPPAYQPGPEAGAPHHYPSGYGTEPAPGGWPQQPAPPTRGRFLRFMQSGYTCPSCGEGHLPGAQYCTACCTALVANPSYVPVTVPVTSSNSCPYCGTAAASTHRFCRTCGASRPTFGG